MGFSVFEKSSLQKSLRSSHITEKILQNSYPEDIIDFLKDQNLLKLMRDYAIIPHKQRLFKPESLTLTYLLDTDTNIFDIISKWQEFLSPPVRLNK